MRYTHNWFQFARFGVVGASGYLVNLVVFWMLYNFAAFEPGVAATGAFTVALANNFFWNRTWTFSATEGHAGFQAMRSFAIAIMAFLVSLGILEVLINGFQVSALLAQATAVIFATPLNFLGNRMWSFRL